MKLKGITSIVIVLLGVLVLVSVVAGQANVTNEYNSYLAKARKNAEREIPYVAYNNYRSAMEIRGGDENVYIEYLEQAKLLGDDKYSAAIKQYVELYPESANAYELYCSMMYETGSYKSVIDGALAAREKGIATEKVKDLYLECSYMLRGVAYGFDEAQSFLGNYARVKVGENYGYISASGNFLLGAIYPGATVMREYAAVNDGHEWHMINALGYKVARTSVPVDSLGVLSGGKISVSKAGKYGYADTTLVIPEELPYEYASTFKNGVAAVKKDGKWAIINADEQPVTQYIFEEIVLDEFDTCINNGVIFVKHDGKYYMMDSAGTKISDQGYDAVYPFASTGPAAVCVDNKWGYVDSTGKLVIEPTYENAKSFSLGLGAVCVDGKWGYITSTGEVRIEMQFEDCLPFASNGIAAVKVNGIWQYQQLLPYYY